jgi:hypothetical protein
VNLTASKLELLERCPSAGALPAVWTESTDDQRAGTARHRFVQRARELKRDEALAEIPADAPWRAQCEALDVASLPPGDCELAYAYDVTTDTARCLGPWLDRAYVVSATEVSGTADLVCPPHGDQTRWLVIDFKGEEEVTPATQNLQLGFYALCVARVHGLDAVDVAIGYLGHGGGVRWDRASLDVFDLEAVATRVLSVYAAVEAARAAIPGYATGLHCRRCPALTLCPAQTQLVREMTRTVRDDATNASEALVGVTETLAALSDADAGHAWVRVQVLEELVAAMKSSLRARAEVKGLPLPSGDQLVPVEVLRRSVVIEKALPILRERFGDQVDALVERSLSADAVGKLARQVAPGKGQKKAVEELWGALAEAGAMKRSTHTQLRVKKEKEK